MRALRLRTKFTLTLLALALVPLAITTAVLVPLNLGRLAAAAREYRLAVADEAARAARHLVAGATSELAGAGAALAEAGAPVDDRLRAARARLLGAQFIDRLALYDRAGSHVDTLLVRDAAQAAPVPPRLAAELRAAAEKGPAAYGPVVFAPSAPPGLPLVVALWSGPERTLFGYAYTTVDLAPLGAETARISAERFGGAPGQVYVIDAALRIVGHGDPARRGKALGDGGPAGDLVAGGGHFTRDLAYTAEYTAAGVDWLSVIVPLTDFAWAVVVEQRAAEAYAAVATTWQTALAVGGAFALLALGVGLWSGRRLAAPVLELAASARRVAAGDFAVRVHAKSRDEVGELAGAFNRMAGDLGDYRDRLVAETRIRTDLSRYLSAELVEGIIDHRIDLALGGERREVTVLFADVVAFTPLAERHPPERVVAILNELFTFLTEIVFQHGGIVDKFLGDCVMAVWGTPHAHPDDPVRAVRAADAMLRWLEAGNARWQRELGTTLQLAIGINTGPVVAGNIGSQKRMEYTVIGDVVNVAARLETVARPGQILMTRATAEHAAAEFDCPYLTTRSLTGREQATEIFTLVD